MTGRSAGAALLALGLGAGVAAAPVLHEPVQVPKLRCEDGVCRKGGDPGAGLPDALSLDEGLVRAPSLQPGRPGAGDQVYEPMAPGLPNPLAAGAPAPGADPPPARRLRAAPDRQTGAEPPGQRLYHEVFNPAVYPFKRMTVLDAVAEDETLAQRDPAMRPLAPEGARLRDGRDPFYGAVTVDLQPRRPVPVPSPAAGLRLLSFEVTPPAPLRFYRDGADNLYVIGDDGGRHQLVYLVDAEQRYFAGPLAPASSPRPKLRDAPAALRAPLPRPVQHHADRVLRHLGLNPRPDDDYQQVLDRLVAYFRDFQMGDLRGRRGSTYLDIAFEQRGACRHRAYAFVITALGAGVPARYVENELHVFAEVYVPLARPGQGYWRRVHLGGAPLEQRVLDAEDKVAYRERGGDPFPQPPAFTSAGPRQVEGLPSGQRGGAGGEAGGGAASSGGRPGARPGEASSKPGAGAGRPGERPGEQPGRGGAAGAGADPRAGAGPGAGRGPADVVSVREGPAGAGEAAEGADAARGPGRAADAARPAGPAEDDPVLPRDARPDPPGRPLLQSVVTVAAAPGTERALYRGALLRVSGRVGVRGGSAAGLEVHLSLEPLESRGPALPLGRVVSGEGGAYKAEIEVPREAALGDHRLVARVRGDADRRGSTSRR